LGTSSVQAAAYNLACGSVTPSTTPDWVGPPVSVEVQAGLNPQINLTLSPNVPSTVNVSFVTPAVGLGAGALHMLAVGGSGSVRAWGFNNFSQLGDGTTTLRTSPVATTVLGGPVTSLAGGFYHSCALTAAGALQCWGYNFDGELGDGTTNSRAVPFQSFASGVKQVDAGDIHTCVVKTDGSAWCTGGNGSGQVGNGTTTPALTFVQVLNNVEQVSAGTSSTCARLTTAIVSCWGNNNSGQIGQGTTGGSILSPTQITGFNAVAEVSVGSAYACARKSDGTVWCWGNNAYGQLGDGTTVDHSAPVQVPGITTAVQITTAIHTCARLQDETVRCWGRNQEGQLGDGSGKNSSTPVTVRDLVGVAEIVSGQSFSCARLDTGAVQCWGNNQDGQLGDGTQTSRFAPASVAF
jgi:alpha-tubulin suppressor-like RCC1 family protein